MTQTENQKDEPETRKIPDSIRVSSILPFRGVPWRSVAFRGMGGSDSRAILDERRKCRMDGFIDFSESRRVADFLAHFPSEC